MRSPCALSFFSTCSLLCCWGSIVIPLENVTAVAAENPVRAFFGPVVVDEEEAIIILDTIDDLFAEECPFCVHHSSRTLKDAAEEAADAAEDAAKDAEDAAEEAAKDAEDAAKDAEKIAEEEAEALAGRKYLYTHAGLMIVGWGLLLPAGVIIARLARHRPGGLWFKFHRFLQISGLVVVFIAWMVAMNLFDDVEVPDEYEEYEDLHKTLGLVVMVVGLLQPLNAIVRPHAPKEGEDKPSERLLWEIVHKGLGYSAVVLAVFTILLGTTLLPTAEIKKKFRFAYGLGVGGLLLALIIALLVDKFNYEPPQPVDLREEQLQ